MFGFKSFGNLQYKGTEYKETVNKFYNILRRELETIIEKDSKTTVTKRKIFIRG